MISTTLQRVERRLAGMRPEESWSLAIDVGTTFCVVAARRGQGEPQVVEIGGQRRVPSVIVVEDDGTLVVGQAADNLAAAQPARALRAPKNRLGDPSPVIVAGRLFDSAALIAALLRHLYDAAVAQHGGTPPASVRLTHPAIWGRPRVEQLRRAAAEAGLPEIELLAEPVAAAMAHAHAHAVPNGTFLAVYDLGGGTFDAAVVQATAEGFVVVGRPVGEDRLGGELFDELLANAVAERLEPSVREALQLSDETAWMQAAAALRAECRRAKEALSSHPYAELMIPLPTGVVRQQVTREQFEALIEPYVAQSVDRLVQAVADAGLQQSDLAAVCLSGGASYMPMVARAVEAAFAGVAVERRGDPKTAVAVGAALPSGPVGTAPRPGAATTLAGLVAPQPGTGPVAAAGAGVPASPTAGHGPPPPPGSLPPHGSFPPGSVPPGSFPPGSFPPPAAPSAPSARRRLLVPALAAVVAVIAVVAALLVRGGGEPLEVAQAGGQGTTTTEREARDRPARRVTTTTTNASTTSTTAAAATLESPAERFLGTEIRRRWQTDPAAGTVTVAVTLTSTATAPFRWHHDEPLPTSLVAAADAASVRTEPVAELPDSGVLRWWFELAPAQAATFTYVVARQAGWPASLDAAALHAWERERAAATVGRQNAVLAANQLVDRTAAPGTAAPGSPAAPVVTAAPGGGVTTPPIVVQTPVVQQPSGPPAPTVSIRGSGQLCAEQPSVIEGVATNAVSGVWTISSFTIADASWSPQSPTQTLTPSLGAIGGTYRATLQVVNGANVAATAVFDFTVVDCTPPPTVEIQGPASVCVGGTGYFTGVASNAVLGEWDLPEFAIEDASWTPDSPSMYVQPSSAAFGGTYTFTLTVVGPSGALATAQRAFSVNC